MRVKIYTKDDVLAGELEIPEGVQVLTSSPRLSSTLFKITSNARNHEQGFQADLGQVQPVDHYGNYSLIRDEMLKGINRFVLLHEKKGHFLMGVLSNDLKESFARADGGNLKPLHEIVRYCYNEIPSVCWGSPEKVKAWLAMPREEWGNVEAPETTKEKDRQAGLGIFGGQTTDYLHLERD